MMSFAYDLTTVINTGKPKIIFCESEKGPEVENALNKLSLNSEIVTFGKNFLHFLEMYRDGDYSVDHFQATGFDTADTTAFIIATSGTTGPPKAAIVTHKNFAVSGPRMWCKQTNFPTPTALAWICAPLQWLSPLLNILLSPILTFTRLQSSAPMDQQHCYYLINKYRPTWTLIATTLLTSLMKMPDRLQCDFTCFEFMLIGGSAVPTELIQNFKQAAPAAETIEGFGMSEMAGPSFFQDINSPPGSCGKPVNLFQYRLTSLDDEREIMEPNIPGELWLRGPEVFKGYYNDPDATKETITDDGWFRTGDIFSRDSQNNYFYVDRIKLTLKYNMHPISPNELETLIRSHPNVEEVVVTAVPDPDYGDLVVACIVRNDSRLTAQEIKDLVKDNLSESKQLHGGVVFLDKLPTTASFKVDRRQLKQMVLNLPRE